MLGNGIRMKMVDYWVLLLIQIEYHWYGRKWGGGNGLKGGGCWRVEGVS